MTHFQSLAEGILVIEGMTIRLVSATLGGGPMVSQVPLLQGEDPSNDG